MAKMITTDKRLYDTDAYGIKFLAFPVGAQVSEADYKRLTAGQAPVENKKRGVAENKAVAPAETKAAAPVDKPLKRMNTEELQAVATAKGIDISTCETKRDLMEAIVAADAAKESGSEDDAHEAGSGSGDEE